MNKCKFERVKLRKKMNKLNKNLVDLNKKEKFISKDEYNVCDFLKKNY